MTMANCMRCRKLFPKIIDPICDACKKEEEVVFERVKRFLEENKESTVKEISKATGVSAGKILGYLRDGRLEISAEKGGLNCRNCGAEIGSGNFCESCQVKLNREINDLVGSNKPIPGLNKIEKDLGTGMHTKRKRP